MPQVSCRSIFFFASKFRMKLALAKRSLITFSAENVFGYGSGIFVGLVLASASVFAQTTISGAVNTNTHWTVSNSPYLISGNVAVQNGAKLTVDPGVTIYMGPNANLTVESGGIQASGRPEQIIRILSDKQRLGQAVNPGDWGQWKFGPGTTNTRLDYVQFENGKGLVVEGSSPELNYVDLKNHQGSAISIDLTASPRGIGNKASGNEINGIVVPAGAIVGSARWGLLGIPYVVSSGTVSVGVPPTISSFYPNTLQVGESATVSISGSRLSGLSNAKFDLLGLSAQILGGATANQAQLQVTADANAKPGAAALTLMADAGQLSFANALTLLPIQPRITSVTPENILVGQGNLSIEVIGLNFAEQSVAYIDATALATTYVNSTQLRATIPNQTASGMKVLTVQTPNSGGSTLYSNGWFMYASEPNLALTPKDASIDRGAVKEFTVSIPFAAPSEGLSVNLYSGDAAVLTVPSNITISGGKTNQTFNVIGKQVGVASVSASRANFAGDSTYVSVIGPPSLTFTTSNVSILVNKGFDLTVQSNRVAGAGGTVINLESSNPSVVRVPASITIPSGQQSASVRIDGLSSGSVNITATGTGYVPATVVATIREQTISISKLFTNLAPTELVNFNITLSDPAPAGGLVVALNTSVANRLSIPANVTIPAGSSNVSVSAQAMSPGSANLTLTAPNFRTEVLPVSVDVVTISLTPTGPINVVVGGQQSYSILVSRALPFPLTLTPTVSGPQATITPNNIVINAGQLSSGSSKFSINGVSEGSTLLNLGAPIGFSVSPVPVSIGSLKKIVFRETARSVPKGFTSSSGGSNSVYVQLKNLDGTTFVAVSPVEISLQSSDSSKVGVASNVTIPTGQSGVSFPLTGIELTSQENLVSVNATASGFASPEVPVQVEVSAPKFIFLGLEAGRLINASQNIVSMCIEGGYRPTAPITVQLGIRSDTPNIIEGIWNYYTYELITERVMNGECATQFAIGSPRAEGRYRLSASAFGLESLSPEVVVYSEPQIVFEQSNLVVGSGMKSRLLRLRRVLNGVNYPSRDSMTVMLSAQDSSKVQLLQQSATFSPNSTYSTEIFYNGLAVGETTINATVVGKTANAVTNVKVVQPYVEITTFENQQAVGERLGAYARLRLPGVDASYGDYAAKDIVVDLGLTSVSTPAPTTGFNAYSDDEVAINQIVIPTGSDGSYFYVAAARNAGSYRITTSINGGIQTPSKPIPVYAPQLHLVGEIAPLNLISGYLRSFDFKQTLNGQPYYREIDISAISSAAEKVQTDSGGMGMTLYGLALTNNAPAMISVSAPGYIGIEVPVNVVDVPTTLLISEVDGRRSLYSGPDNLSIGIYPVGTTIAINGRPSQEALCPINPVTTSLSITSPIPANVVALDSGAAVDEIELLPWRCAGQTRIATPVTLGSYRISASASSMNSVTTQPINVGAPELALAINQIEEPLDSLRLLQGFQAPTGNYGYSYLVTVKTGVDGKPIPGKPSATIGCQPTGLCTTNKSSVLISTAENGMTDFKITPGQLGAGTLNMNSSFATGSINVNVLKPKLARAETPREESSDPDYDPNAPTPTAPLSVTANDQKWLGLILTVPGGLNPLNQRLISEEGDFGHRYTVTSSNSSVVSVSSGLTMYRSEYGITVYGEAAGTATITFSAPGQESLIVPVVVSP